MDREALGQIQRAEPQIHNGPAQIQCPRARARVLNLAAGQSCQREREGAARVTTTSC